MGKKKRKAKFRCRDLAYVAELLIAVAALITAIKH